MENSKSKNTQTSKPQSGKGSQRRAENFRAIQNNWDNINWGKKHKTKQNPKET